MRTCWALASATVLAAILSSCDGPKCQPALAPSRSCAGFDGRWHRADGALFDIRVSPDCDAIVELPGPGFEQSMRAKAVGNEIVGGMVRRNRQNGCTVTMRVHLILISGRIWELVEGVEGLCDIGPNYREANWLDML